MRRTVPLVIVVLAVLLIAVLAAALGGGGSNLDSQVERGEKPAAPAADVALPNLGSDGATTLQSLRGQVVVLNIWASWCPPCEDEAPLLVATQQELERQGSATVLGATHIDARQESMQAVQDWGLSYPTVRDVDDELYDAFGARGVPETYILDREGRIVAMARQPVTPDFLEVGLAAAGAKVDAASLEDDARRVQAQTEAREAAAGASTGDAATSATATTPDAAR